MNEQERVPDAPKASAAQSVEPAKPAIARDAEQPERAQSLLSRGPRLALQTDNGPRFWALPDRNLGWWIVREQGAGAAGLTASRPTIFTPAMTPADKVAAAECCRKLISSQLRDIFHSDLFNLVKRLTLGGMLCIAGVVGLRIPGELEFLDMLLLLGALGYSGYAALRYGTRVLHSFEALNRPFSQYAGEPFVENALLERLSKALVYRASLPASKRGEAPDEELLDSNAFRTLLANGAAQRAELLALGTALYARLNLDRPEAVSIAEICEAEGLDPESAALYRDVALAARDIELEAPQFS